MAANLDAMYHALVELDEERTLEFARKALVEDGATPHVMVSTCQQALRVVGERYERGKYFLVALVMAGELFKEVLELTPPIPTMLETDAVAGRVVLGTAGGDIHDIGKNLFGAALGSYGFQVIDLGVDVPKERFLTEIRRVRPDVVCMSGLILPAFDSMRETSRLIRAGERNLGYRVPIVIGGGTVDGDICAYAGADSWSTDAMEGVRICQELCSAGRQDKG